jgi:MoxR-like ATPase
MQEHQVTVEGRTHWLPLPFMVIATQNPYEQAGIYPLPESQLDRFIFKIHLEYASAGVERAILRLPRRGLAPDVLGDVAPILDGTRIQTAQEELDASPSPDDVIEFIVDIVRGTRELEGVMLGASPRGAVHLLSAAKANARLENRPVVTRGDVVAMAPFALPHRLIVNDDVSPGAVVGEAVRRAERRREG